MLLTVRSLCSRDVTTKRKNMAENGRHTISAKIAIYSNLNVSNGREMSYVEWNPFKLHRRNGNVRIEAANKIMKKDTNRAGSILPDQLPNSFSLFLSTFQFNRMKRKKSEQFNLLLQSKTKWKNTQQMKLLTIDFSITVFPSILAHDVKRLIHLFSADDGFSICKLQNENLYRRKHM